MTNISLFLETNMSWQRLLGWQVSSAITLNSGNMLWSCWLLVGLFPITDKLYNRISPYRVLDQPIYRIDKPIYNMIRTSPSDYKILKFRSFISKEEEGFVIIFNCAIPEIVFEDILCQLFAPLFEPLQCPDVFYFSSTDEILSYQDTAKVKDYIYVHFLPRTKHSAIKEVSKFKLGDLNKLAAGINFEGNNLFIFSEKCYAMYEHTDFCQRVNKRVESLKQTIERKENYYREATKDLNTLKNNLEFVQLKEEIDLTMEDYNEKLNKLKIIANRYGRAKATLQGILKESGIYIRELKDLY